MGDKSIADFRFPIANLKKLRFTRQWEMGNWQSTNGKGVIQQS